MKQIQLRETTHHFPVPHPSLQNEDLVPKLGSVKAEKRNSDPDSVLNGLWVKP